MSPKELRRARCRGVDPEIFFPTSPTGSRASRRYQEDCQEAKLICGPCPVRGRCLEDNLRVPYGVFGGLDEVERASLAKTAGVCATLSPAC